MGLFEARGSSSCWPGGFRSSCSPSLCERWSASDAGKTREKKVYWNPSREIDQPSYNQLYVPYKNGVDTKHCYLYYHCPRAARQQQHGAGFRRKCIGAGRRRRFIYDCNVWEWTSFFVPWTPPPGPACREAPSCCEASADGPPESTHPALCLHTDSTPAEPGRWRSTASEREKKGGGSQRMEEVELVYLCAGVFSSSLHITDEVVFFLCVSLLVCAMTGALSWAVSPRHHRSGGVNTYICLDELTALLSYSAHKAEDIHPLVHVHHVDHAVNDNERPGPPHPSTAGGGEQKKTLSNIRCHWLKWRTRSCGFQNETNVQWISGLIFCELLV